MPPVGFIQSELDLKLLILYIMARTAGPITFLQLLDLALCDAGVDYFSLSQAVDHMVETGQLSKEGERYTITEKGRRMHCDENLARVNDALRRDAQIQTHTQDNGDGTCTLHLEFNDATSPLLRLSLLVPNQERAAAMSRRFREDPAACYHQIIQILSKEQEESL